jgi:release factor glutamine methyltransferase
MVPISKVIKSFKDGLKDIYPLHEITAIIEVVLDHYLSFSKTDIILKSDHELSEFQYNTLISILERLIKHEPIQYILGETYFYNLKFIVKPGVLIPRQETEELTDWIIKENKDNKELKILDIGTGSGCIAVTLAANIINSKVTAFDISSIALEIAKNNAEINSVNVQFKKFDILNSSNASNKELFNIIVSNPPYVLEKEKNLMQKNVLDYEPSIALFVENDNPLLFYKAITEYSVNHLINGGKLYFEINEAYGYQVEELLQQNRFDKIELKKDINGKFRMISGTKI